MIKVGRSIEGISLNGFEWLLEEENGDIKWFDTVVEAKVFLLQAGATSEDLWWYRFADENGEEVSSICLNPR